MKFVDWINEGRNNIFGTEEEVIINFEEDDEVSVIKDGRTFLVTSSNSGEELEASNIKDAMEGVEMSIDNRLSSKEKKELENYLKQLK